MQAAENQFSAHSFDEFLEPFQIPETIGTSSFEVDMIQFQFENENQNSSSQDLVQEVQALTNHSDSFQNVLISTNQEGPVNSYQNSNLNTQEISSIEAKRLSKRVHLNRSRKTNSERSALQKKSKGYWTKNFLPVGKNSHLDWLLFKKGSDYFKLNSDIQLIRSKVGIALEDYLSIYSREELKEVWEQFFSKKLLYREVMLSRAQPESKIVYIKFLHRFEEAYRTGVFDHIA